MSQFTLFANFKGLKPDFHESMVSLSASGSSRVQSTQPGKAFYTSFLDQIRSAYVPDRIKGELLRPPAGADATDGQFGAMMAVSLTNDVSFPPPCRILAPSAHCTRTIGSWLMC